VKYFWSAVFLIIGESLAALFFHELKSRLGPDDTGSSLRGSVMKGILERTTVLVGLLTGLPHVLTVFGALKIGTRLDSQKGDHISNTYFLTGNLVSILLAMLYAWGIKLIFA
jgi:hypothetical protein